MSLCHSFGPLSRPMPIGSRSVGMEPNCVGGKRPRQSSKVQRISKCLCGRALQRRPVVPRGHTATESDTADSISKFGRDGTDSTAPTSVAAYSIHTKNSHADAVLQRQLEDSDHTRRDEFETSGADVSDDVSEGHSDDSSVKSKAVSGGDRSSCVNFGEAPIVFYQRAAFCTDLSSDPNPRLVDEPSTITFDPVPFDVAKVDLRPNLPLPISRPDLANVLVEDFGGVVDLKFDCPFPSEVADTEADFPKRVDLQSSCMTDCVISDQ